LTYRKINYRETWNFTYIVPLTGNYVPVNEVALIKDNIAQLSIVTDRSRGGASQREGELELMLHRRLLVDDGRGVNEPLNETEAIRTTTAVIVTKPSDSSRIFRERSLYLTHPLVITFAPPTNNLTNWLNAYKPSFVGLTRELPKNLHLQTWRPLRNNPGAFLFRLRHLYGVGEDSELSKPVTINVDTLFTGRSIASMRETQLTGILDIDKVTTYNWRTTNDNPSDKGFPRVPDTPDFTVTLNPLDIRTWVINFN